LTKGAAGRTEGVAKKKDPKDRVGKRRAPILFEPVGDRKRKKRPHKQTIISTSLGGEDKKKKKRSLFRLNTRGD